MPSIVGAELLSRDRERLTRRRAGEDLPVVFPAGESEGEGPASDATEEVMLGIATNVLRLYVSDAAWVDVAIRDESRVDQVVEPLDAVGVDLVVISLAHLCFSIRSRKCQSWAQSASQNNLPSAT